uniref:Uncharacterized protein n=1 Tax=Magallana gigas TaxID=29159 RepID=A0A8W8NU48_MAGGI
IYVDVTEEAQNGLLFRHGTTLLLPVDSCGSALEINLSPLSTCIFLVFYRLFTGNSN